MTIFDLTLLLFSASLLAGFLGSLTGLGGGVVIVPLLTLAFKIDIRYAIGASLISVIATSCGAAAAYVKEGFTNIRIGMFLELATTLGAITGAMIATKVAVPLIAVVFGAVLIVSAFLSFRKGKEEGLSCRPDSIATRLKLNNTLPTQTGFRRYYVQRVPQGFGLTFIAGILSGLLGIGSGAMKVLAMDHTMKIPFKVSSATSNFMIGVTAAASAGIYLNRGYIDPGLAMPVMLGVLAGATLGTKILIRTKTEKLRLVFGAVIFLLGIEMIFKGLTEIF